MNQMNHRLPPTDPASLARLLELDESAWPALDASDLELAAMLAHQLAAPITADLKLSEQRAGEAARFGTFANVFDHPSPPLWLLQEIKQLAKRNRASGDASVRQISTILYYNAIATAMLKCDSRISELTDVQLREGFGWTLTQAWIDDDTKARVQSAAARLQAKS